MEDCIISWAILCASAIWAAIAFIKEFDRQYEARQREYEFERSKPENQWWTV